MYFKSNPSHPAATLALAIGSTNHHLPPACDGAQSLKPKKYTKLIEELREIGKVVGKEI